MKGEINMKSVGGRGPLAPGQLFAVLLLTALGACGDQGGTQRVEGAGPSPTETPATGQKLPAGVEFAEAEAAPGCEELPQNTDSYSGPAESEVLLEGAGKVPGTANIYGAGLDAPPAPGGGGGGVLPPVFDLAPGTAREVRFSTVTGRLNPITGKAGENDPNGDRGANGSTNVKSLGGISGIVNRTNGMFLVGVFLSDAPTSSPAPPRLDFTLSNEREFTLEPLIGQVFFVGNGKGRSFIAPDEATRLFLGFADAFLYEGCPGWYGNNRGQANVAIEVTTG